MTDPMNLLGQMQNLSERREAGIPPSSERGPSGPAPKAPRAEMQRA
jgi:hypothetical protein